MWLKSHSDTIDRGREGRGRERALFRSGSSVEGMVKDFCGLKKNESNVSADVPKDQNTKEVGNEHLFLDQTTQDNVQISKKFPLRQASKHANTTSKMKLSNKRYIKKKKEK